MANLISNQFQAALTHLLRQEGRGAQVRLSVAQNIDRGYLNAIIKGRKPGAEDIRARIATHFGMAYEEMLALGRRILEGKIESESKVIPIEEAVLLPGLFKTEKHIAGGKDPQEKKDRRLKFSAKILKVLEILESNTEYGESLSVVIDAYHEAIAPDSGNQALASRLKVMEDRMEKLEGVLLTKTASQKK
jgi:hypothetical protein